MNLFCCWPSGQQRKSDRGTESVWGTAGKALVSSGLPQRGGVRSILPGAVSFLSSPIIYKCLLNWSIKARLSFLLSLEKLNNGVLLLYCEGEIQSVCFKKNKNNQTKPQTFRHCQRSPLHMDWLLKLGYLLAVVTWSCQCSLVSRHIRTIWF